MLRDFLLSWRYTRLSLRVQFHSTAAIALRVLSPFKVPRPRNIRQVATEFGANSRIVSATPTKLTTPAVALQDTNRIYQRKRISGSYESASEIDCHACDPKRLARPSHSTCPIHQIFQHGYTVCLFLGVMRLISSCRNAFELRECDTSDLVRCWRKVPITRCPGRNTPLLPPLHDAYLVFIALWRHALISTPKVSSSS